MEMLSIESHTGTTKSITQQLRFLITLHSLCHSQQQSTMNCEKTKNIFKWKFFLLLFNLIQHSRSREIALSSKLNKLTC
ncbi:CLUMA_CG013067, isoform A [Clunio marinus]|uniref:CLUMA_CG013067, isoform A n=1 Tax=Clunio marinus TaxID=568069 RepID=A0A1J1IHS5_9DIPT|nr:CLUMA_CG013067, isoform A [Clunio marinus]